MKMYPCEPIGMDFFENAPFSYSAEEVIRATPEQIFDAFEDAESWPVWALPIQKVEWTSPKPFQLGTTRTVSMMGGMVGEEEFIAWERGRHMAFRFNQFSSGATAAFGENYTVADRGDGSCTVRWTMAMKATGINKIVMPLASPIMTWSLKYMLGNFRVYVENLTQAVAA